MEYFMDLTPSAGLSEKFRIAIDVIIRDFCTNQDVSEFIFPQGLTNEQRKYIHEKCKILGLVSKSQGKEPHRKLHMSKQTKMYCKTFYLFHHENTYLNINRCLQKFKESIDYNTYKKPVLTLPVNDQMFCRLSAGCLVNVSKPVSNKLLEFRQSLPVWPKREEFLQLLQMNQVVIVTSETGSGKSTQIPQFILEDVSMRRSRCKIICTQPRRLSTVAVAERVAEERGESIGTTVGYHIKLQYMGNPGTALMYCTNGILLRTLMNNDSYLKAITHIIVDEIHERDKYTDFLLICLKQNLQIDRNLKIILMSATADVKLFANYFQGAKILHVPGRNHSISQLFLEDILSMINNDTDPDALSPVNANRIYQNLPLQTEFDYEFKIMNEVISNCMATGDESYFDQLLHLILSENSNVNHQTEMGYTPLMAAAAHGKLDVVEQLLHLGSNLNLKSFAEGFTAVNWALHYAKLEVHQFLQMYETYQPEDYNRYIYDTSALLEIYDRTVSEDVIDFELIVKIICYIHSYDAKGTILIFLPGYEDIITCQEKILSSSLLNFKEFEIFMLHGSMNINMQHGVFNIVRNKHKIILSTNIAETSLTIGDVIYVIDTGRAKEKSYDSLSGTCALQKIWISKANVHQRAGRSGRTSPGICFHLFSKQRYYSLPDNQIPEIIRVPLHEVCLQTKFLAPHGVSIANYLKHALEPPPQLSVENSIQNLKTLDALSTNEELTILGQHLIQLSVDPRLGKMLIYSIIFKCLDPVLTIVSCLAYRDPFIIPQQSNLKQLALKKQKELMGNFLSDHLMLLRAFQLWQNNHLRRDALDEYFISWSAMEIIYATRTQLLSQLRGIGFVSSNRSYTIHEVNANSNNWAIVKAALTAGCYPNICFTKDRHYATKNEKRVVFNKCSALNNLQNNTGSPTDFCIIYEELSKIGQHCSIKFGTAVTPITVALICGKEDVKDENSLVIDDWLNFQHGNSNFSEFRQVLSEVINKKVQYPQYVFSPVEVDVLNEMYRILNIEEQQHQLPQPDDVGTVPKPYYNFHSTRNYKRTNQIQVLTSALSNNLHINNSSIIRSKHKNHSYITENAVSNQEAPYVSENHYEFQNLGRSINHQIGQITNGIQKNLAYDKRTKDIFPTEHLNLPANTAFFIIKPPNYESLQRGISSNGWIFAPQSERKIFKFFNQGYFIILFFNITKTIEFQGIARLLNTNGGDINQPCPIHWLSTTIVSFDSIRHRSLRNAYNNNNLVYKCRDGQGVEINVGKQLCGMFFEETPLNSQFSHRPILGCFRNK